MKKLLFLAITLAVLTISCKEKKSEALNYNDADPIQMTLREYHQVDASSDYSITYTSADELIVEPNDGNLYGKNVGETQITLDNGYETKTVDVNVTLFTEPTFEFGCDQNRIKSLYGDPYYSYDDSIFIYGAHDPGYSYACWQMNFFFDDNSYYESDVYILNNFEYMLNLYLEENFVLDSIINIDSIDYHMYHNIIDNTVKCGKFYEANEWGDICLFYFQSSDEGYLPKRHKVEFSDFSR